MHSELGNPKSAVLGPDPSTQSTFRRRVALFLVGTICALKIVLLGCAASFRERSPSPVQIQSPLQSSRVDRQLLWHFRVQDLLGLKHLRPLRQCNYQTGYGCDHASALGNLGSVLRSAHFILLLGYPRLSSDYGAGGAYPRRESRN